MTTHLGFFRNERAARLLMVAALALSCAVAASAGQIDLNGPAGSGAFGASVTVLPNGNFVITDPNALVASVANAGAVYLYSPSRTLITTLTGSHADDQVGSGGVVVVGSGNFAVMSPNWNNGSVTNAGAVTWVNGTTGLAGVVSASNSLVGSSMSDGVGSVTVLTNGNYVVNSPYWSNGATSQVGAATWANGNSGVTGVITSGNSLIGSTAGDNVGYRITALTNGNYVVGSANWDNAGVLNVGAATWGDGTAGITGTVSVSNSLIGSSAGDYITIGGITALSNGNYVVLSSEWNNGAVPAAGAATWGNGSTGLIGTVSAGNSLVGSSNYDRVGASAIALTNGNYVVASRTWNNASVMQAGAATWGNGSTGSSGVVSAGNSLVGSTGFDHVGNVVTALSNGNYVVGSVDWDNGMANDVGAATWGNGTTGTAGAVSPANSLIGSTAGDSVGYGVTALTNGNYVVNSPAWSNGMIGYVGAATWANGSTGLVGAVSVSNSLIGTTPHDNVADSVTALSNGNYVVASPGWTSVDTGLMAVGAATWANGTTGLVGTVSPSNSLIGLLSGDRVGSDRVTALSNGNYVVGSSIWNKGATTMAGATTWGNGNASLVGPVTPLNSLVGTQLNDGLGSGGITALTDGNYVVVSPLWDADAMSLVGAVTLAGGSYRVAGVLRPAFDTVSSTAVPGSFPMVFSYDATRHVLIVGVPNSNIVSLLTLDRIFADTLE